MSSNSVSETCLTGLGAPRSPSVSAGKVTPIQPMAVLEHRGGPKGGSLVTGEVGGVCVCVFSIT